MECTLLRNLEISLYTCPSDEVVRAGSHWVVEGSRQVVGGGCGWVVVVGSRLVVVVGSRWDEAVATRAVVPVAVGLGVTRLD